MPATDRLTNLQVKKTGSRDKSYKLFDGGGMFLLVNPNGSKYWRLKYLIHDKEKLMGLGVYPETSLIDARNRRNEAKRLIKQGIDPIAHKRELKRQAKIASKNTFKAIALEWYEKNEQKWAEATKRKIKRSLERDVYPEIGLAPISSLKTADLVAIVRKIEKRDALDYASRVLQWINNIFRYAVQTDLIEYNPASDMKGVLKTRKVKHRAALSAKELPEFFTRLDSVCGEPTTLIGLRLLVLLFVRPGELRYGRWEEIDFDKSEWRIPAERMKMRAEHIVPLSTQAIKLLKELKKHTGQNNLMFPGRNRDGSVISENTWTYALRKRLKFDATAHGFRATASTILNEANFKPDVIERQLAHVESNKIRAAYHRTEYLEERREMMQWWADYLDSIKNKNNVVPIKHAK